MKLDELTLTSPYLSLDQLCYQEIKPQPLNHVHLIHANRDVAKLIGLDEDELESEKFVEFINGSYILKESKPYAMCYAGHQFGYFVSRLGDGRAINLGKINGLNLQLKGAGQTLYSRSGDGRAVLRSSIREYLASEAMHGLGIATTRALAIVGSKHRVFRERWESGAIVLRVSPSWIRFGSFEYFTHAKKFEQLKELAEFTLNESFPHLVGDIDAIEKMYKEVVEKTALMIAQWMGVGFNHGVMNSDNMSIAGLSIDYGPFAFLDDYDRDYICNHTDYEGRYSFSNQPQIGYTNLVMLANALAPLVNIEKLNAILVEYEEIFNRYHLKILREKLGLKVEHPNDRELLVSLFELLQNQRVDYTHFFRVLSHYDGKRDEILKTSLLKKPLEEWLDMYDMRLTYESLSAEKRKEAMLKTNPKYVLKNYMLQEAIDKAKVGDFSAVDELMVLAKNPYDEHPEFERFAKPTPDKYKNLKLSCSS